MSKKRLAGNPKPGSSSESAKSRPAWLTKPCPPWCSLDHREQDYYADRHHFATAETIDLSLYDAIGFDNTPQPGRLDMSVFQHYRHAEPDFELVLPQCEAGDRRRVEGETSLMLTVGEAQALRDRLSTMLALVGTEDIVTP